MKKLNEDPKWAIDNEIESVMDMYAENLRAEIGNTGYTVKVVVTTPEEAHLATYLIDDNGDEIGEWFDQEDHFDSFCGRYMAFNGMHFEDVIRHILINNGLDTSKVA